MLDATAPAAAVGRTRSLSPSAPLLAALGVAAAVSGVVGYELLRTGLRVPRWDALISVGVAWTYVAAGLFAWRRRPASRVGPLIAAVGAALLVRKVQYSPDSAVFVVGTLVGDLSYAVFVHAVFAYPTGYVTDRWERLLLAVGYPTVVLGPLATLLTYDADTDCLWTCTHPNAADPANPLLVDRTAFDAVRSAYLVALFGILGCAFVALLVRRWAGATSRERRLLAPLLLAALLAATRAVVEAIFTFVDVSEPTSDVLFLWQVAVQAAVPLALVAGLLAARLHRAHVADLVVELEGAAPGRVRDALRRALQDPTLDVLFWLPDRGAYVDAGGRVAELPPDDDGARAITRLDAAEPIAAIVHDPVLRYEPKLVAAAAAATRTALENERLHVELRAQLRLVEESRRRIASAAVDERRRIERDLHDGAQQRLLALGIDLRRLERDLDGDRRDRVDGVVRELEATMAELRELAHGLHPRVLEERGLAAALTELGERSRLPAEVVVAADVVPRHVESAAYFVACEAVANALKHAGATALTVHAAVRGAWLVLSVGDDGVGGADPDGSGLRGLRDRVEAFGGRVEIETGAGRGTTITAAIPLGTDGRGVR